MTTNDTDAIARLSALIHPGHERNNILGMYWHKRSRGMTIEDAYQSAVARMPAMAPEKAVARRKSKM